MTDIEYRKYEPSDEEQIVKLLDLVFGGWPDRDLTYSNIDFWRWKYHDNPLGKYANVIALHNNQIIGCVHGYYLNLKIGNKTVLCGQGMDAATHPDFRRQGVYSQMQKIKDKIHIENKRQINYVVQVNPILIERAKRRDRKFFPHPILDMVRIKDIKLHLAQTEKARRQKRVGFHLLKTVEKFSRINMRTKKEQPNSELQISNINMFDERINDFWEETKSHYNFILERNQSYLNWRYCDRRAGEYIIKLAESQDRIIGYMVLRINRFKEYQTGHVVDLLTLPGHGHVIDSLLQEAETYFDEKGINAVRQWVIKGHPLEKAAKRHGFINSRSGTPIITFNHIYVGIEWYVFMKSNSSEIHFQMGDTEWM